MTDTMSMLDYTKMILKKVSFDPALFEKELKKSLKYLMEHEVRELRIWCLANFGNQYNLAFQ